MYLKDQGEVFLFDPNEMMSDLGYSMMEIMQLLSSLTDKKMITVDSFKNEHGIMEEKINLSSFYEKLYHVNHGRIQSRRGKKEGR